MLAVSPSSQPNVRDAKAITAAGVIVPTRMTGIHERNPPKNAAASPIV
jgi:hypothetical protein